MDKREDDSDCAHNRSLDNNDNDKKDRPGPHWRVWQCIEQLLLQDKKNRMMAEPYRETTKQVASILEKWGYQWAGNPGWAASLLNKRTLHHEAEECIVALYHLRQWMTTTRTSTPCRVVAVDVCGGKGFFSMFLSFMVSNYWQTELPGIVLDKIILLEKCTTDEIDWSHIHETNARAGNHVKIEIWAGTNLHDYDKLVTRFRRSTLLEKSTTTTTTTTTTTLPLLAFVGIHLCRTLSPSLVSLANGLACSYLCVAPCCLPRVVRTTTTTTTNKTIPIYLHETQKEHEQRIEHNRLLFVAKNNHSCYYCLKKKHWIGTCPELALLVDDPAERQAIVERARQAKIPCWSCGLVGHYRSECPTPNAKKLSTKRPPPTMEMDVSSVMTSKTPFEAYCQLLATHVRLKMTTTTDDSNSNNNNNNNNNSDNHHHAVQVIEAGLTDTSRHKDNWNSRRKSIFIVASSR